MVKIMFAKGAKTIEILEDVYSKDEAQAIAEQNRIKAFGVFNGIVKIFEKNKRQIMLSAYQKRYVPFWHVIGESIQEYKRKSNYGFPVKPEVRSVTFNNKTIAVSPDEPYVHFDAEDHCFEQYSKEILQSAVQEKEKNLERYLGSKRKKIRNLKSIQSKDTVVEQISMRASFIVNQLIKELIKPIQADKIIQEIVEIKKLAMLLRPVHVFEFKEEGSESGKTIEVDAITGAWKRGNRIISEEMKKHLISEGIFEVGAELAATVIPGAGVSLTLGKKLKEHQELKRNIKQMKAWRKAYETRKKRK
ncbi:MAG: hypothetical protein QXR48_01175 [Candidatus Woesearchaeota archaeon]